MTDETADTAKLKDQARQLIGQNRLDEARALARRLCDTNTGDAQAWHLLGLSSARMGDMDQALAAWRQSLTLAPDNAETHYYLGNVYVRLGRREQAVEHFRAALRLKPDDTNALNNLGTVLSELNRLDEAAQCYNDALALAPNAITHYNLATVYMRQQRLDQALDHFRRAQALEPQRVEIHNNLGNAFKYQGRIKEAEAAYREAMRLKPEHPMAYANLGTLMLELGRIEEAHDHYQQALTLDPNHRKAAVGLADIHEKQGRFEQAYDQLRPFLAAERVDADAALVFAALCRPLKRGDEAIALMERLLAQGGPNLDVYNRISLHFALGRLYDAARDYDRAFGHYREANTLADRRFDPGAHARYIDGLIKAYSPAFMARAPRAGIPTQRPILIIGMPRSGTSLVEQILASHPAVFGAGELEEMHRIVADLPAALGTQLPYPECLDALSQSHCDTLARRYVDHLASMSPDSAARVTDKMPTNFMHLGLINLLLPGARVIQCIRDPMDTCLSCYFQYFAAGALPYAYDLSHVGAFYKEYQRLMDHWRKVIDIPMMEVVYEDLVADQEGVSRALVDFCGLAWDERCLRYHETPRVVATASYDQVRQPMYSRSAGRWRHYAPYLGELQDALGVDRGA